MTGRVAVPGAVLRHGAQRIAQSLSKSDVTRIRETFAPVDPWLRVPSSLDDEMHASWLAIGAALACYTTERCACEQSVAEALAQFNPALASVDADLDIVALVGDATRLEVFALLPYLLDPLALGTRRSLLESNVQAGDRHARKKAGIFYTPADLADYMTRSAIAGSTGVPELAFDPAVGSGVFLRAAAGQGVDRLMGVDINPIAADLAAFVLMTAVDRHDLPMWTRWHLQRLDLATGNTLLLANPGMADEPDHALVKARHEERFQLRETLLDGCQSKNSAPRSRPSSVGHLAHLFPELADGADLVLSNPPYAPADHSMTQQLSSSYACRPSGSGAAQNLYPLFVEYAVRAASKHGGRVSVVTPLSLAFGSSESLRLLRGWLTESWDGDVEFAHFDRTPDALFGDDVKTRNTVLTLRPGKGATAVTTTSLLRWTSRNRQGLFESIRHQPVDRDVTHVVPRLGTDDEARVYRHLRQREERLADWLLGTSIRSADADPELVPSVYVAPTAYNWLGCLPDLKELRRHGHDASTKFIALALPSTRLQMATYAIATSRVAHFLWRVEGDGFHVTRRFLQSLPRPDSDGEVDALARLGEEMWRVAAETPIRSRNAGRTSVSFPGLPQEVVDKVDQTLMNAYGIVSPPDLNDWHETFAIVDKQDDRRVESYNQRKYLSA